MTTKVTVDAHASWPVKVIMTDKYAERDAVETTEIVEPNMVREFYVTNNRSLTISEEPLPVQNMA